jgi:hypothetical protein
MTFLAALDLVLLLLEGLLSAANHAGATAAVESLRQAIASLRSMSDTPVTKQQVESLRLKPEW